MKKDGATVVQCAVMFITEKVRYVEISEKVRNDDDDLRRKEKSKLFPSSH